MKPIRDYSHLFTRGLIGVWLLAVALPLVVSLLLGQPGGGIPLAGVVLWFALLRAARWLSPPVRADALMRRGKYAEALALCDQALAARDEGAWTGGRRLIWLNRRTSALLGAGRAGAALVTALEAMEVSADPETLGNCAMALVRLNRYDEAIAAARLALSLSRERSVVGNAALALALLARGLPAEAEALARAPASKMPRRCCRSCGRSTTRSASPPSAARCARRMRLPSSSRTPAPPAHPSGRLRLQRRPPPAGARRGGRTQHAGRALPRPIARRRARFALSARYHPARRSGCAGGHGRRRGACLFPAGRSPPPCAGICALVRGAARHVGPVARRRAAGAVSIRLRRAYRGGTRRRAERGAGGAGAGERAGVGAAPASAAIQPRGNARAGRHARRHLRAVADWAYRFFIAGA